MVRPIYLILGIGVAVVAILAIDYWFTEREPPQPDATIVTAPPPAPAPRPEATPTPAPTPLPAAPPAEPAVVLPALDESDAWVREQVLDWPVPSVWRDLDELLRRAATVLDNAAKGSLPRGQLGFMAPAGRFPVVKRGQRIVLDPAGYARYDGLVDAVTQVPAEELVEFVLLVEPLLGKALGELGVRTPVPDLMESALDEVLATPAVRDEIALLQPKVVFTFADPDLEARSELQKQLLRMGPDNVEALQQLAERIRRVLRARARV